MSKHIWIIKAWFWLGYYCGYEVDDYEYAEELYKQYHDKATAREAVEEELSTRY
jgi:hypothetical protein